MAETVTLLDIAKANGNDGATGLIDETIQAHPELGMGQARRISGLNYRTLVRTSVPTGGAFRNANEGTAVQKGAYAQRLVETFIFNPRWEADKAVADRYEDGAEAYIALEAGGIMEGAMQDICKQFYYGRNATFGNAKGFPGLLDGYDLSNMLVDAGGTTAATASSVWAVKWGPKKLIWVWGNNGDLEMADPREESIVDSGGTNKFTAYVQEMLAYPGLQIGNLKLLGRIQKLTADTGKGLTDILLAELLEKFPAGIAPDVFLMNRRSLFQLQSSRTATNPTGSPAPIPDQAFNVPIAVTDAISNIETLTL